MFVSVGICFSRRQCAAGIGLGRCTERVLIFAAEREELSLHVFPAEAEAVAYCRGLDVESAVWSFWDDSGMPLVPEFIVPNRHGLFSVRNGTYRLVKADPASHGSLLEVLEHIRTVRGLPPLDSVSAIERHLTGSSLSAQIVAGIVRNVLGAGASGSAEDILHAAYRLAVPRNGRGTPELALFCTQFLNAWKNWNYDLETNGERWVLHRIAAFEPRVVFDVGANVGDWTIAALAAMPHARIHAFEIIESTRSLLAGRMSGKAGVIVNGFGLSDHAGVIKMHAFDAGNTLASHVAYPHGSYREVSCPVRRGDEYMQEHEIPRVDFLKLDVEGAEHLVLSGFRDALETGRIDVIQFEYGKVNILTHFLLRDFHELLESRGYLLGKVYPDHVDFRPYVLEDEDFLGPNYLAVRRARADIIAALRVS
jgi:FkbM family methyltransferase